MELTFIGTGSGKTNLKRYHTSILLRTSNHSLLIDSGDGTARALKQQAICFNEIDSVLFTHYHADHYSGIASLITQMKLADRSEPLNIYTHESLVSNLNSFLRMCYLFIEAMGFDIHIIGYKANKKYKLIDKFNFIAKQNSHISNKHNITNQDDISFVSFSLLIVGENNSLVYTSDIGCEKDLQLFHDKEINILITETTHVTLDQIYSSFINSSANKLYLTHIDDDDENIESWRNTMPDPEKIIITQDGLTIKL